MDTDFISTTETAEILGCHRHTVTDFLNCGILRGELRSRTWFVEKDSVLEYRDKCLKEGISFRKNPLALKR